MKKILLLVLLSISLGAAGGFGTAWYEYRVAPCPFEPYREPHVVARRNDVHAQLEGKPRVVIVGGNEFDFGKAQRGSVGSHSFVVRNEGQSELKLSGGETTCKCTLSAFEKETLAPGEETNINLEWTVKTTGDEFRQTATVQTNDDTQPEVFFEIFGKVIDLLKLEPMSLALARVSATEGATVNFRIYGYELEQFEVVDTKFSDPETAPHFDLSFRELTGVELAEDESGAMSGLLGTVTLKPGLPLGAVSQNIEMTTNAPSAPNIMLPLRGSVVSDVSVVGSQGFSSKRMTLRFGAVDPKVGAKRDLRLLVKGPRRDEVKVSLKSVDPEEALKVTMGERSDLNNGAVYVYPLTVEVLKGAPPVTRMGGTQGTMGEIVIETTHPGALRVPIHVIFAVQQQ